MSEEQLSALLAKLKEDAGLREKLQGAADLDAAVALAQEAGFDVSKADWIKYQAEETIELSDKELEFISGGDSGVAICYDGNNNNHTDQLTVSPCRCGGTNSEFCDGVGGGQCVMTIGR